MRISDWSSDVCSSDLTAGMSRTAFTELFTQTVGQPPIQYLAQWRATEARRLLKNRRFSVAAIAEMMGYRSEAAFRRFFKRVEGVGPGKVRAGERADAAGCSFRCRLIRGRAPQQPPFEWLTKET